MKKYNFTPAHKHKAFIEITPMIDLIFLLVAFFMVSSTLGKISEVEINLPETSNSEQNKGFDFSISIDSNNNIYMNNEKSDLKTIKSYVGKNIDNLKTKKIIVRGDKKSDYEYIVSVMDLLSGYGLNNFILATQGK